MVYNTFRRLLRHLQWRIRQIVFPLKIETTFLFRLYHSMNPDRIRYLLQLYRRPVIIGGCGRSGTTLLLSVLSCHPKVLAIGDETGALCPSSNQKKVNAKFFLQKNVIIKYLAKTTEENNYYTWAEKTPRNVLSYRALLNHFGENARIINIIRDGRDVVTSIHPSNPDKYYISFQRWIEHVEAGRKMQDNQQVLNIKYENLVLEYESTVRKICEFINLDYTDRFSQYPDTARITGSTETNAWFNNRTPINPNSISRWKDKQYKQRIDEFMSHEKAIKLMRYYGYIK